MGFCPVVVMTPALRSGRMTALLCKKGSTLFIARHKLRDRSRFMFSPTMDDRVLFVALRLS